MQRQWSRRSPIGWRGDSRGASVPHEVEKKGGYCLRSQYSVTVGIRECVDEGRRHLDSKILLYPGRFTYLNDYRMLIHSCMVSDCRPTWEYIHVSRNRGKHVSCHCMYTHQHLFLHRCTSSVSLLRWGAGDLLDMAQVPHYLLNPHH